MATTIVKSKLSNQDRLEIRRLFTAVDSFLTSPGVKRGLCDEVIDPCKEIRRILEDKIRNFNT
jgi:hypothetical protein